MPRIGYREIADRLRSAINAGEYAPGDTIPTLDRLMAQYDATSGAVRKAVDILRAEGLVTPMRRHGTVVRDRTRVTLPFTRYAASIEPTGGGGPWETACAAQGLEGRTERITVEQRQAVERIARLLHIEEGALVVYRLRHMYAGNQVAQISESFMPLSLVDGTILAQADKVEGGVYRALASIGHPPRTVDEDVTARMPTPEEAETLYLDLGAPVVTIERTTYGEEGDPLEVQLVTAAADRVKLFYEGLPLER